MRKKLLFLFLLSIFIATPVLAHQPRLIDSEKSIGVQTPEISQAFYGEFNGSPVIYTINSDKSFLLYANVLVPDLPGIKKDVSAEITRIDSNKKEIKIASLDASEQGWIYFWEEFAGDAYYKGPEFRQQEPAGIYKIKVSRANNQGKYVLAIGDTESFTFISTLKSIRDLPALKVFFNKSPLTAYFNKIGEYMLFTLLALAVLIFTIVFIYKKLKKRKNNINKIKK